MVAAFYCNVKLSGAPRGRSVVLQCKVIWSPRGRSVVLQYNIIAALCCNLKLLYIATQRVAALCCNVKLSGAPVVTVLCCIVSAV